ncbi:hypothetical protein LDENG_00270630 [Lucifuga dentata]|nr:hypothetical protein LDENG_00270630 [Lucifuga dentata]
MSSESEALSLLEGHTCIPGNVFLAGSGPPQSSPSDSPSLCSVELLLTDSDSLLSSVWFSSCED